MLPILTVLLPLLATTFVVHAEDVSQLPASSNNGVLNLVSTIVFESRSGNASAKCMPWSVPEAQRCRYVKDHRILCGDSNGIIGYLHNHYCYFGRWPVLSNLIIFLWIGVLCGILTVVADRFFCPALEVLADFLKLPANVAGATLLSFGNGAPDVFTQLAAVSAMDSSAVSIAIGEPLGGGLFVSNIVLAAVVLASPGRSVAVEPSAFMRDSFFYLGGTFIVGCITWDSQINGIEALVMLLYYAAFVVYIVVHERMRASALHIEESRHFQEAYRLARELARAESAADAADTVRALEALPPSIRTRALLDEVPGAFAQHSPNVSGSSNAIHTAARSLGRAFTMDPRSLASVLPPVDTRSDSEPLLNESNGSQSVTPALANSRRASGALSVAQTLAKMSWREVLEMPVVTLLRLTMPEVGLADTVRYPKPFAMLLPVTAPLFVVLGKGWALTPGAPLGVPALLYGLFCSLFSSAVIYSIYPKSGRHYGILSGFFTALTFSMSILWMGVAAGEMVRAWKCVGYIHGLSQQMLGVTVLAWANSFGDAVADVAMAMDGFPTMAIAACFASPFFTMVGGLGIAFSVSVLMHGAINFTVEMPLTTALCFLLFSTLRHVVLVPALLNWRLNHWTAIGMIAFYACFQVIYLVTISATS